jgi:hypothetical protein
LSYAMHDRPGAKRADPLGCGLCGVSAIPAVALVPYACAARGSARPGAPWETLQKRRLRTHVDAHRASGCPWQNQPANFKRKEKRRIPSVFFLVGLAFRGGRSKDKREAIAPK